MATHEPTLTRFCRFPPQSPACSPKTPLARPACPPCRWALRPGEGWGWGSRRQQIVFPRNVTFTFLIAALPACMPAGLGFFLRSQLVARCQPHPSSLSTPPVHPIAFPSLPQLFLPACASGLDVGLVQPAPVDYLPTYLPTICCLFCRLPACYLLRAHARPAAHSRRAGGREELDPSGAFILTVGFFCEFHV